ncbi:MAG: hypothetical protein WDN24_11720 [Sphingomonas sp.]
MSDPRHEAEAEEVEYSRAFENIVESASGDDDVVGLVAYGLYKQAIREEVIKGGIPPTRAQRNPSRTTVMTYRGAAEQLLTQIVQRAIEETTPEIQRSAVLTALEATKSEIKSHVTTRTDFGSALLANFVAWIITLAIASFIIFLAGRPAVEQSIVNAAERVRSAAERR